MSNHRAAYLAELRVLLKPQPGQPHVVYDQKMPPYHFQKLEHGGGWCSSGGKCGRYRIGDGGTQV